MRVQEKTENSTKKSRVGRTVLECCLFSPMGAFQLNCKLKRIFYSSASPRGYHESRRGNGRNGGKQQEDGAQVGSRQELNLPFSVENFLQVWPSAVFFRTENTGHNLVSDSANFERTQVKSNHPSCSDPASIHSPSCKTILHPYIFRLQLPFASSRLPFDRPVTGFPWSGNCGSFSPIPSSALSFLMYFCSLFCTTAV